MNYEKIYNQIILRAKSRELNCYVERHHIIPKCMGGTNDKDNLVKLTAREHFICHKLLCEIHPTNDKLKYALWSMSNQKNLLTQKRDYSVSSKEYERLKIIFSTLNSKTHRGKKYTNETKEKMSKSHLGKKLSPETIEKLKNRIVSNETREKRSKSLIGIPKTEEHKMSMRNPKSVDSWSKGMKNRWNNNQLLNNKLNQPTIRKIKQLDLENNLIKVWDSIGDAVRIYGCGVSHCLIGRQKKSKGYIWVYEDNNPPSERKGGKQKNYSNEN